MIHSMTAFGSASAETEEGRLTIEIRSVNSRYLDIHMRVPEELRALETPMREQLTRVLKRGKIDLRLSDARMKSTLPRELDTQWLAHVAQQLSAARELIPDLAAPGLHELLRSQADDDDALPDLSVWSAMCLQACEQALAQLQAARRREGQRLAQMMRASATEMEGILTQVEQHLPIINQAQHEKISTRLREALESVSPEGFSAISGAELSTRIAQEAALFSLRNDIAEELARLRSHLQELAHLLSDKATQGKAGSAGKRLDFLCQEMNREANTIGSKAASLETTRAAIDLKLLIEQLREQAQNIE